MRTENVLLAIILLVMIFGIGYCERMRWNECRRVHPWWYCFEEQGRKR